MFQTLCFTFRITGFHLSATVVISLPQICVFIVQALLLRVMRDVDQLECSSCRKGTKTSSSSHSEETVGRMSSCRKKGQPHVETFTLFPVKSQEREPSSPPPAPPPPPLPPPAWASASLCWLGLSQGPGSKLAPRPTAREKPE